MASDISSESGLPTFLNITDKFLFPIRFFSIDERQLSVGVEVLGYYEGQGRRTADFNPVGGYIGYGFWHPGSKPGFENQPRGTSIHFAWEILKSKSAEGKENFLYIARAYTNEYFT